MPEVDLKFISKMLVKYLLHLNDVEIAINKNLETYARRRTELERLAKFKPEVYQKELDKVANKIEEADIKLSHIVPNIAKLQEQISLLEEETYAV